MQDEIRLIKMNNKRKETELEEEINERMRRADSQRCANDRNSSTHQFYISLCLTAQYLCKKYLPVSKK